MTIDTKVAAAYTTTSTFETSALTDYSDAVDAFMAAVDAIFARFPESAKSSAVYQCVSQGRSLIGSNYQLQTLKQQYGLVVPIAPASTPTA